ncbi:MAG: hypothetical protein MUF50_05000 [Planctomycetes bacterium]|jgi:hypothetical protein|nr:hypothetical protein [Planctomycetota bacterium]
MKEDALLKIANFNPHLAEFLKRRLETSEEIIKVIEDEEHLNMLRKLSEEFQETTPKTVEDLLSYHADIATYRALLFLLNLELRHLRRKR